MYVVFFITVLCIFSLCDSLNRYYSKRSIVVKFIYLSFCLCFCLLEIRSCIWYKQSVWVCTYNVKSERADSEITRNWNSSLKFREVFPAVYNYICIRRSIKKIFNDFWKRLWTYVVRIRRAGFEMYEIWNSPEKNIILLNGIN